jgi:hypothetical protein
MQSKGGMARSISLTKEKKHEIGIKAAKIRWTVNATHQGVIKILDKELPCVVLEDGRRILAQSSVFKAFERPPRGKKQSDTHLANLPSFLQAKNLQEFITQEILEVIRPIEYLAENKTICVGYSAETIPIVCDIYLSARKNNKLTMIQQRLADLSELLIKSLSQIGIIGLIDEATGYQQIRPKDALQSYLNKILTSELAAWCKRFPDEFYSNIYKIRGWSEYSTSKNKYSCVGNYTNDLIYSRLGTGVLEELKNRTPKNESKSTSNRYHQWLSNDIGHPLLSQHMHAIIILQRLAIANGYGWKRFIEMVDLTTPKKEEEICIKELGA